MTSGRSLSLSLVLTMSVIGPGCEQTDSRRDTPAAVYSVRDSAGIKVVTTGDSVWRGENRWVLSDDPVLVIGGAQEKRPEASFQVVGPVQVLSDGTIAISDLGAREVRLFDMTGQYLRTLGREGDGPGEIRQLGQLGIITGDTVVVFDPRARKSVYFSPDGSAVRSAGAPPRSWNDLEQVSVEGWTPEGAAVVTNGIPADQLPESMDLIRTEWHLFSPDGEHENRIGDLPSSYMKHAGIIGASLTWGGRAVVHPAPGGIWYAFSSRPELVRYEGSQVREIIRFARDTPLIPEELKASWESYYWESREGAWDDAPASLRAGLEASMVNLEFAERYTVLTQLEVSDDGHLWLRDPVPLDAMLSDAWTWEDRPHQPSWTVIAPDGRLLGRVAIPREVSLLDVTGTHVVASRQDSFEVTQVVVYELVKGGDTS